MTAVAETVADLLDYSKASMKPSKNNPDIIWGEMPRWAWDTRKADPEGFKKEFWIKKTDRGEWLLFRDLRGNRQPLPPKPEAADEPIALSTLPQSECAEVVESKLLPYQIQPFRRLLDTLLRDRAAIDASQAGTGKTYVACALVRYLNKRTIVVCPKALIPTWQRVAALFGATITAINYERLRTGTTDLCYETDKSFHWNGDMAETVVIFDECHALKGQATKNAQLAISAKMQGATILGLSATLADNPMQLKAMGYVLGLHGLKDFFPWAMRNGCFKSRFGMSFNAETAYAKNKLLELHRNIFPSRGIRLRIKDLGDAFPETRISADCMSLDEAPKIQGVYDELDAALEEICEKEKDASMKQSAILVAQLRARQKVELLKLGLFRQLIEDALEEGQSVVVFLNFDETLTQLAKLTNCTNLIRGGQTPTERQQVIDDFQSNKATLILANIKAGGVGLSLHDLSGDHPRLALISPTYSGQDLIQTLGRTHRSGGKSVSTQRILFADGTIEVEVAKKVEEKINRIETINDGDLSTKMY